MTKPKLLFICSRAPYPPIGGDRLKNYYLLPELKKTFEITLVCMSGQPLSTEGRQYLEQHGTLYFWHKSMIDYAGNVASWPARLPMPLQVSLYYFKDIAEQIKQLALNHDAIFCNLIRTAAYAHDLKIPKFCDMADNMSGYYQELLRSRKISPALIYSMLDQSYIQRYEERVVQSFDQSFLFNPDELSKYNASTKLTLIPHGVNPVLLEKATEPSVEYRNSVVFLGKMDTLPNATAVEWFANEVLPLISESIHFVIIGANPPPRIRALASNRVKVLGFVEDPYPALRGALAVVAPMQIGSGIQNKVLEAMAVGGLCILTPSPAKALESAQDGREFLIARDSAEFAETIQKIAYAPEEYDQIREVARRYIMENHSWRRAGTIYTKAILDHLSIA